MGECLSGRIERTTLGKGVLRAYGAAKLEGLNYTDFFQSSDVNILVHIGLKKYRISSLTPHLRGLSSKISLLIRREFYDSFDSILQQTFEAGYKQIEKSKDPFVEFAAMHAFEGHEQTLQEAIGDTGNIVNTRIIRTLRIIDHFTQVRFLQTLIAEFNNLTKQDNTFQSQVWKNQIDDHLTATGLLLMKDAEPQVLGLTNSTIEKINALRADLQQ